MHRPRLKANKTHTKSSQDQHVEENIFNILKLNQGDIVTDWCCGPYRCFDDFLTFFCVLLCVCISICICKLQERECLLGAVVDLTALGFRASLRHRESTRVLVTAIMDYVKIL